jgi:hypothetical protein
VDFDEFAVNIDGMVHPDAGADVSRTLTEPYNCWSWSINPLTHRLTWEDPPNINTVTSVQELAAVVNDYLRTTYGCTIVQYEGATVVEHLQAIDGNQFVIAMRTGAPAGDHHPISYHFARYIFGQWSYKDGAQGRLIMARANTPELEPDSFWKEHDDMTHMRTGTRRFPCNTDSERRTILNNNIVYTSKTIYLIITLPTG